MEALSNDRFELVLMNNDPAQTRLWMQTPAGFARRYECDKDKSIKLLGAMAVVLLLMLYFAPAFTIISFLVLLIILVPLSMVGMAGYSRTDQG